MYSVIIRIKYWRLLILPCSFQLYDLDNNQYDEMDVVQIYYDVTKKYKKANPRFMGAKVIYAPLRIANDSHFLHYLDVCRRLHVRPISVFLCKKKVISLTPSYTIAD